MTTPDVRTPGGNRASAEGNEHADSSAAVEQTPELCDAHCDARDAHQKRFETLRACMALKGFALLETGAGVFVVSRWNLTRTCSGLSEVEEFALQAGCST